MGAQVEKKTQAYSQLLFGREGLWERLLLLEKRPLPQSLGMNVMVNDAGYVLLRNGLDGQPNLLQMASLVFQS